MPSGEQQVKAIIIYDSRRSRGATAQIVQAIAQTLGRYGIQAEAAKPSQAKIEDKELVVIGSPIYEERAMKTVTSYIEKNKEKLASKKVAVFIVCMAQLAGKPGKLYAEKHYLPQLAKRLAREPDAAAMFRGWLIRPNPETLSQAEKWALKIAQLVKPKNTET